MSVGEEAEQDALERLALADDGALDLGDDLLAALGDVSDHRHRLQPLKFGGELAELGKRRP